MASEMMWLSSVKIRLNSGSRGGYAIASDRIILKNTKVLLERLNGFKRWKTLQTNELFFR